MGASTSPTHAVCPALSCPVPAQVSVTDLRLLKPVPASMVTSLTYALHFVETDFSCPGLYRYSKTKKTSKILKVVDLLERGQRVKVREFRDAVGQNGAVVGEAENVSVVNENCTRPYLRTRRTSSPTKAMILIHNPNPLHNSLRSSQPRR